MNCFFSSYSYHFVNYAMNSIVAQMMNAHLFKLIYNIKNFPNYIQNAYKTNASKMKTLTLKLNDTYNSAINL